MQRCVRSIALVTLLCVQVLFASAFAALSAPTSVSVSGLTPTSGTLQWEVTYASAHDYDIIVSTQALSSSVLGNATTPCTVTAATEGVVIFVSKAALADVTSYSLTGLTEGTHYFVYIRQNGESQYEDHSAWVTYEFSTPCVATSVLPVLADFDGGNYLPSCWSSGAKAPTFSSAVKHGESGNSMLLSATASDGCFAYSPVFTGNAHAYYLSAYVYGAAGATYRVGVAAASDLLSIEPVLEGTIAVGNTWQPIDVTVPVEFRAELEQGIEYVWVIYNAAADNAKSFYVDDVVIDELPACISPAGVTASGITSSSVVLNWNERGTATSWVVEYVSGTDTLTATASATQFSLTDLTPNTYYVIRVKAVCSADDQSSWSSPIVVKTPCGAVALPFLADFTGLTAGVPECWDNSEYTCAASYTWNYYSTGHSGPCLRFNAFNAANGSTGTLYSPVIANGDVTNLAFTYYLKNGGNATLDVYVSTDGGQTFSDTIVYANKGTGSWVEYEVFFTAPANSNIVLKFVATSDYGSYRIDLDDVVLKAAPSCLKPSALVFREATSTTLKMEIQDAEDATAWEYAIDTLNPVAVTEKIFTIDNLTPETAYTIFVRRACSATDHSEWISARATTMMAPVDFIEEDFNNTATRIKGWTIVSRTSTSYPSVYSTSGVDGTACWYISGYSSTPFSAVVALPEIAGNLSGYRLLLDVKKTTAANAGDILLGVADAFGAEVTYVDSITPNTSAFATYVMDFSSYAGTGKFPVLQFKNFQTSAYIDNVVLEPVPTCEHPQGITASNATATTVDIVINDTIASHSAWEVVFVEGDADSSTSTPVLLTEKTATVAGTFAGGVQYSAYVRVVCSDTDKSKFRGPATFSYVDYSLVTDLPLRGDGSYPWGIIAENDTIKLQSTNQGVHNSTSDVVATVVVPELTAATLSFDYSASGESGYDYLCVYVDKANPSTTNFLTDFASSGKAGTPNGVSGTYSIHLTSGTHTVRWRFRKDGSGNDGQDGAKVWNIQLTTEVKCEPDNLQLVSVDATGAVVSWTQCEDVVKNEVMLGEQLIENTSNSITFTDLTPATYYTVKVRSIMAADTTDWSSSLSFHTECAPSNIPFVEGFEVEGADLCWKTVGNAVSMSTTTVAFDGSKSLKVINDSVAGLLVSPQLDAASLAEYEVGLAVNLTQVRYHADALKPLTVGVMTDPTDAGTYIDLGDIIIPSAGSWKEYRFSLADLATADYADWAGAQYIAISMSDSATYFFDAITIAPAAACPKPTVLDAQPVGEGTEITWVSDAAAHYAEIAFEDSVVFAGNVQSPFVPAGLETNTPYKVRVRAVCDADSSEWTPWVSFTTPCTLATMPYSENFDSFTGVPAATYSKPANVVVPDCWTVVNEGTGIGSVASSTTYANSGSNCVVLAGASPVTFFLPAVDAENVPTRFRFNYKYESTSYAGLLAVGYVTAAGDIATFVAVDTLSRSASHTDAELYFPAMQYLYPVIRYIPSGTATNWYASFDDVLIERAPTCMKPTDLQLANVTINSARLDWTAGDSETQWQLIYKLNGAADTVTVNGAPSYTISGLTPATAYTLSDISLKAVCSATDESEALTVQSIRFTTDCETFNLPVIEDFNNLSSTRLLPACWTTAGTSADVNNWYVDPNRGVDGTNCVSFDSYENVDGRTGEMKTGKFNINIPDASLTFTYKNPTQTYLSEAYGGSLKVYVEKEDGSRDLLLDNLQSSSWTDTIASLAAYNGQQVAIVFSSVAHCTSEYDYYYDDEYYYGNYVFVDNFMVSGPITCERPEAVVCVGATATSATVQITDAPDATAWEYVLNDLTAAPVAVTSATFEITGLQPRQEYTIYVRRVCGAGNVSAWRNGTILTACGATELPYTENFDSYTSGVSTTTTRPTTYVYPDCWDVLNAQTGSTSYPQAFITSNSGYNVSGKSFFVKMSSGTQLVAVLPAVDVEDNAALRVKFSYRNEGISASNGYVQLGYVTNAADASSFVLVQQYAQITSMTAVSETVTLPAGARIAFRFGGGSANNYYAAVDNVEVDLLPNCLEPAAVDLVSATDETALFAITDADDADAWEYVLNDKSATPAAVAADTFVVSGLLPLTDYTVFVRRVCGAGDASAWIGTTFTTDADCRGLLTVPFAEGFETYPTGTSTSDGPYCWDMLNTNNGTYPYAYVSATSTYVHSGSKALYMSSSTTVNAFAVMPAFETPLNQLRLKFDCKFASATASGKLYVGYMTDPTSAASFVQLYEINQNTSWQTVTADLAAVPAAAEGARIAFKYGTGTSSGNYLAIDDIEVTLMPLDETVESIVATNVQRISADLTWTPAVFNTCNQYELVLSTSALSEAELATAAPIMLDTTFYQASELLRGTRYYAYVRTGCAIDGGFGKWVSTSFITRALSGGGDYTVNPTDGTSSSYVPYAGWYHNSYAQAIYTPADLENCGPTTINAIDLNYYNATSMTRHVAVYMANITENKLTGFLSPANLVEVYAEKEYTFSNANGNWDHMVLDTPFDYTGGNLLVVFYMNYNACETFYASGSRFYTHSASSMTRYLTADTATPDYMPVTNGIYTGTSTGTNSDYRPNIRFWAAYEDAACPVVTGAEATLIGLGTSEVQLSWPASDGDYANTYEVCIADTDTLAAADIVPQYTGINSLGLRLTGLQEATQYYAYIRVICNARGHDEGASEWIVVPFATNASCLPVVDLVATVTGKHTAKAIWSKSLEEQDDAFLYILSENELDSAALAVASAMPIDTTALAFDNLLSDQTYHLYVAASCGNAHSQYVHTSFTMPSSCPAVVALTAVRVSEAAATLSWAHAQYAEEDMWEVGIVGDASFTQLVADTMVTFFGLADDSTYTAYVKAICAEGDTSAVATAQFTTLSADATSCITSGEGTSSDYAVPFNSFYNNTWNQIIYTADQIGRAGTITSISFNLDVVGTSAFTANQLTIYMANTDMAYAEATDSWVPQSDLVQVFTASRYTYPSNTGWVTFELSTPFDYDGGNLAVITSETTSSYSSAYKWKYSVKTSGVTLYRASDTDAGCAQYPTASGTKRTYQPDATFCFATGGCMKPMSLKVANLTTVSADMSWFPGGSETAWEYVLGTSELTAAQLEEAAAVALSDVKTSLTGLVPDQDYYFYVRALCTDTTSSDWAMLHFVTVPTCLVVSAIEVEDVSANTATISWTSESEGIRYVVAYAPVATFNLADPASYATVQATGLSAELSGLLPNTAYAVAVRTICSESDMSRWSEVVTFRTDCGVMILPFAESFEDGAWRSCWTNEHVAGTSTSVWGMSTSYVADGDSSIYIGYQSTGNKVLLATPQFAQYAGETVRLSFSLYHYTSSSYPNETMAVTVEGNTVQTLTTLGFAAPYEPVKTGRNTYEYVWDVAADDTASVHFLINFTNGYGFYLDDVRIARIAKADTIFDGTCAGGDYEGYGFTIPAAQLHNGYNTFSYTKPAVSDLESDTIFTLNLFVSQPSSIEFTDTVCAHEHYTGYGFDIADVNPLRTTPYVRHLENQYGCDSTVSLTLFVPQTEFAETVHLCEGDSYTFGDSVVTTSGVYVHTYQSQYGCDSTVTLEIFFHAVASAITANICSGETYAFGDQTLDAAGTYTATFQNAAGCDSVVTLTLNIIEPVVTQIDGVFCEGTSFAGGSISPKFMDLTVAGTYTDTLQSVVTGCDSILVLTLVEEKIQHTTVEGTYSDGKPYVYDGQSYQQEGTFEIVKTTVNGCDSIITLVVTKETGFDNLLIGDLHIAPNPVLVGEEAVIRTDIVFSADYVLRVYDAVGRLVAETTEQTGRVPAMPVAGIYTVRIAAAGHHYQAKLIVK